MPRRKPISSYQRNRNFRRIREKKRKRRRQVNPRNLPPHKIVEHTIMTQGLAMSTIRKLRILVVEKTLMEKLGYRFTWLRVFRELMVWLLKKIYYYMLYGWFEYWHRHSIKISRYIELMKLAFDMARGRARLVIKLEAYPWHDKDIINYVVDNIIESLPDDVKTYVIDQLIRIVKTKKITREQLNDPLLQFFIRFYIARYMPLPCRNNSIAIKVTPVIVRYLSPTLRVVTYMVFRWSVVKDMKPGLYLETPQFIDLYHGWTPRYKPENEKLLIRDLAGDGSLNPNDVVRFARDFMGKPTFMARVEDMMLRMSNYRKAYSTIYNRQEDRYTINHCSLLAIPRTSTTYKLQRVEEDPLAMMLVSDIKKWIKRRSLTGG